MPINIKNIMRAVAIIEEESPALKAAFIKLLPDYNLTPEQVAQLDSNHDDYQRMLADARSRAGRG